MNRIPTTQPVEIPADRLRAVVATLLWFTLIAVAGMFPAERLWGINHLAFVSPAVRWGFASAAFCGLLWVAFPIRWRMKWPTAQSVFRGRIGGVILVAAIGVAASLLRAREAFLGDGTLRATDALDGFYWYASEIIPTAVSAMIAQFSPLAWGLDGFAALRIVSIGSACLFGAGLWWLIPKATDRKFSAIIWILTFGSVRLLAGYLETYTPAFVAVSLLTVAMVAYRRGELAFHSIIALWIAAMLSHITSILAVPALIWLFLYGRDTTVGPTGTVDQNSHSTRTGRLPFAALSVILVGGFVLGMFYLRQIRDLGVGATSILLPWIGAPPHDYGIFSAAHLADFANHWFLMAPAAVVGLCCFLLGHRSTRNSIATNQTEKVSRGNPIIFWLLVAGLPIAAGLLIDPKLGWARDWDLFCLLSTPALIGAAFSLDRLRGAIRRAALVVAVLSAGLWLVFSVDGNAERRRFEALLDLDPSRSDYGHEILGQFYRRHSDFQKSMDHYQQALMVSDNVRYRINIAQCFHFLGRHDEAIFWYRGVTAKEPDNLSALFGLARSLNVLNRATEALPYAARALQLRPGDPDGEYEFGLALFRSGEPTAALPHFEAAAAAPQAKPDHLNGLGICYLELRRPDDAEPVVAEALRVDPNEPILWLNAARVSLALGNAESAQYRLNNYALLVAPPKRDPLYHSFLDSLARIAGPP